MAATAAANPPVTGGENKGSRRKKNKTIDVTSSSSHGDGDRSPLAEVDVNSNGAGAANGSDTASGDASDSPYVKELTKNVRNLRKRLANTAKVDAILSANPGKSLSQLLEEKKINTDQKQQIENKPAVEAQVKSIEERLTHYKVFETDLRKTFTQEKDSIVKSHEQELQRVKDEAYNKGKSDVESEVSAQLLTLSRFLRAAAASRQTEPKWAETDAFEGALLLVYGGDESAVNSIQSLVTGDEAIVNTTDGTPSGFSFKHIRDLSVVQTAQADAAAAEEASSAEVSKSTEATESSEPAPVSDPTVVNATLNELEQLNAEESNAPSAGLDAQISELGETTAIPEAATIDAGAANAVAAAATDLTSSISKDWTEVPRNPTETDNGLQATPAASNTNALAEAAPSNGESWAEDVPATAPPANDGFSEVQGKHRGRGRGGHRGSEHRGGEHRGGEHRGRGGFRGGRGRGRGDGENRGRGRGRGGGFRGNRGGAEGGQS